MCGYKCCIYDKSKHSSLLLCNERYLKFSIDQSCNAQNRRSGEIANRLFDTYQNSVMPHGKHIFNTASDMDMATMCTYSSSKYS